MVHLKDLGLRIKALGGGHIWGDTACWKLHSGASHYCYMLCRDSQPRTGKSKNVNKFCPIKGKFCQVFISCSSSQTNPNASLGCQPEGQAPRGVRHHRWRASLCLCPRTLSEQQLNQQVGPQTGFCHVSMFPGLTGTTG